MSRTRNSKAPATIGRYCAKKAAENHDLPKYTPVPKWLSREELIDIVAVMKFDKISFDEAMCVVLSMQPE